MKLREIQVMLPWVFRHRMSSAFTKRQEVTRTWRLKQINVLS